ncbi:MAG: hypothetical protein K9J12_16565 [Melioribacteraceae bacterium]|nr:hypothetical protein [Melioribacteraceae bacterium]MCF8265992.1 hypothetical protein [Melioribacteraceae bacterium]MCF8430800.1 hypothetical protein [Melioribacteraceae bacterium]
MKTLLTFFLFFYIHSTFAQTNSPESKETEVAHKWRVSLPYFVPEGLIVDSWDDRTSTQHLELHIKRNLDNKNIIGVKFASWRLFQPMGITWWDGLLDKLETESEFYPGHVWEIGIGITYQRMLWKGLFATVEVLPQFQTYLDLAGKEIGNDFKLYTSFHLGYHIAFGEEKRFFIEPQINCMYWMFDNNAPDGFKQLDDKWRNYFLFEPQIYIGVTF